MSARSVLTGLARAAGRSQDDLDELRTALTHAVVRLDEPMRVAVVGQIKRGKSTLVNALLKADVAPTDQLEATFTVGEFHHREEPLVEVELYSETRPRIVTPTEFTRYTVNDPDQLDILRDVRRVRFGLPNPFLRSFRLLDTPGLGSIYGRDSDNTLEMLGLSSFLDPDQIEALNATLGRAGRSVEQLHEESVAAVDSADAVVYLFDRALNERDA